MRTSKPISTITWNTIPFLTKKLLDLEKKRVISFWAYISHFPEEDEKKQHIHLFMIPVNRLDTEELQREFDEVDPNNALPIKCLTIKSSKFSDWYLYGKHDQDYLVSNGQSRRYKYTDDDFVVSSQEEFSEFIHMIDFSKFNGNRVRLVEEYVKEKKSFGELLMSGRVPMQQIPGWKQCYQAIWDLVWNQEDLQRGVYGKSHE